MKTRFNINTKKIKRQVLHHVKALRALILLFIVAVVLLLGIFLFKSIAKTPVGAVVGLGRDFIFPSTERITVNNGRVNVLILGIGGAGHDGPDLTDTMLMASISTNSHKMTLISVPRDIWIPDLKDKINSAYMYGKQKQGVGGGLLLAKSTMEEVLGVQVDYAVLMDFGGFKDVIDTLGGISVNVKTGFTDSQYPIDGHENDLCNGDPTFACRYMIISFKPGVQTMDGTTALEFVRSRHASGTEGNDIAREVRQQLVIAAIIKRALTPSVFTNINTDENILTIAQKNIQTDMKLSEEATLARYLVDARANMKSYTIPDSLLYNPPNEYKYFNSIFTHAFVFIPNNKQSIIGNSEDWSDVHQWVQTVLPY